MSYTGYIERCFGSDSEEIILEAANQVASEIKATHIKSYQTGGQHQYAIIGENDAVVLRNSTTDP